MAHRLRWDPREVDRFIVRFFDTMVKEITDARSPLDFERNLQWLFMEEPLSLAACMRYLCNADIETIEVVRERLLEKLLEKAKKRLRQLCLFPDDLPMMIGEIIQVERRGQ